MDGTSPKRRKVQHRTDLNPRQTRFVAHYVKLRNATAAAKAAGYGTKSARSHGARMMHLPAVAKAIAEANERIRQQVPRMIKGAEVSVSRVLTEVAKMANYDSPDVTPDTRYRSKLPANQFLGEFLQMIQPAQVSAGPLFQINIHTTPRGAAEAARPVLEVMAEQLEIEGSDGSD